MRILACRTSRERSRIASSIKAFWFGEIPSSTASWAVEKASGERRTVTLWRELDRIVLARAGIADLRFAVGEIAVFAAIAAANYDVIIIPYRLDTGQTDVQHVAIKEKEGIEGGGLGGDSDVTHGTETDWLNLLAELRQSAFWPVSEERVGEILEEIRGNHLAGRVVAQDVDSLRRSREPGGSTNIYMAKA
jgi:hypothetical protein